MWEYIVRGKVSSSRDIEFIYASAVHCHSIPIKDAPAGDCEHNPSNSNNNNNTVRLWVARKGIPFLLRPALIQHSLSTVSGWAASE